jgi:glucose-1-phosphate thymidylyltransferase
MRPFTHTKPKPLISIAGKPIIAHILDSLEGVVKEVIIIVGYKREQITEFLDNNYTDKFTFHYVPQEETLGLGHAVYLGLKDHLDEPVLITLGDEFFEMDYKEMTNLHNNAKPCDGTLGIKHVDDPRQYGVVTLEGDVIIELEEKPEHPKSQNAISGVYFLEDTKGLYDNLHEMITTTESVNYQLTDALQMMVDKGSKLKSFDIKSDWYDCGRPEMLLNVNQLLLGKSGSKEQSQHKDTVIIDPVIINPGCKIERSVIGPNVSIDSGTVIENCLIRNSVIGQQCEIRSKILKDSVIGDEVKLKGKSDKMNVGESTEMVME